MTVEKVIEPRDIHSVAWDNEFFYKTHTVTSPKRFMVTERAEITLTDALTKVSGFQAAFEDTANGNIPYNKAWKLGRSYPNFTNYNEIGDGIYAGTSRDTIIFGQISEDRQNGSDWTGTIEASFKRVFQRQQAADPTTTINNSCIYGDYFQDLAGHGTSVGFTTEYADQARIEWWMSSQENARKILRNQTTNEWFTSYYYSQGDYEYRHRMSGGYLDGLGRQIGGHGAYGQILEKEIQYLQMENRKTCTFGWYSMEGVNSTLDTTTRPNPLHFTSPVGDILRYSLFQTVSYDMAKSHTFKSMVLGEEHVMWGGNTIHSESPTKFATTQDLAANPSNTKWKDSVGNIVNYNKDNTGDQPLFVPPSASSTIGTSHGLSPFIGTYSPCFNGAWAGYRDFGDVWNYCDGSLVYPVFTFNLNGGISNDGYYNGNAPVQGALGAEVSRYGKPNFGQNNICKQWFNGKRPIVWVGTGKDDPSKKMVFIEYLGNGPRGYITVNIPGLGSFTQKGNAYGLWRIQL